MYVQGIAICNWKMVMTRNASIKMDQRMGEGHTCIGMGGERDNKDRNLKQSRIGRLERWEDSE